MTRSLQAVAYRRPSVLESSAGGRRLGLETSRGATPTGAADHPRFFAGFLASPQVASAGLLAVADVAAAEGIDGSGFRVIFNTGASVGQTVFHAHAHVLGGVSMDGELTG